MIQFVWYCSNRLVESTVCRYSSWCLRIAWVVFLCNCPFSITPTFPACGPEELLVNMYPGFSEKKGDCGSREVSLVPSSFLIGAGFNQVHPQGFSMEPENASLEKEKHLKPPVWGFHVKLQGCILYFCCKIFITAIHTRKPSQTRLLPFHSSTVLAFLCYFAVFVPWCQQKSLVWSIWTNPLLKSLWIRKWIPTHYLP